MAASKNKTPSANPRRERREKITKLLEAIEKSFRKKTPNATLGDFIRLTQLERELEEEEPPGEIIVRWVDPEKKKDPEE